MKINILKLTAFLLILLGSFSSCEKKESTNNNACEFENPMTDLPWLKEYCDKLQENQKISKIRIDLYKITGKDEYVFKTVTEIPTMSPSVWVDWKNCSGETIFTMAAEAPPETQAKYEEFLKDKEFVEEVFYFEAECGRIVINENEFITMQILPNEVSDVSVNNLRIENHTSIDITYGAPFYLEYFDTNDWTPILLDKIEWTDIGILLPAGEITENQIHLYSLVNEYNNGKKGRYRITKNIFGVGICAEFEIK